MYFHATGVSKAEEMIASFALWVSVWTEALQWSLKSIKMALNVWILHKQMTESESWDFVWSKMTVNTVFWCIKTHYDGAKHIFADVCEYGPVESVQWYLSCMDRIKVLSLKSKLSMKCILAWHYFVSM